MRINTRTTLTPSGKVKVKTTARPAPMLPAFKSSATFSMVPSPPKRRRKKRR